MYSRLRDVMILSEVLKSISIMINQPESIGGVQTEQDPTGTPQKRADEPDGPVQNEQHAQQEHGPAPEGARGGELPPCILCLDKPAQVGFEHCNHVCICIYCAASMESNHYFSRCPVCRVFSRLLLL